MKIAAVTPCFNEYDSLEPFSRYVASYRPHLSMHILVDNGSESAYVEKLRASFPNSTLITRKSNNGTTAAFNDGIRKALDEGMDAILLLTQDIRLHRDAIPAMVEQLEADPRLGVVGGLLLTGGSEDRIESFGGSVNRRRITVRSNLAGEALGNNVPSVMDVDYVTGGMSMGRAEAYRTAGLQDERLFMYYDEVDWCLRVKNAGYRIAVTKNALGWHEHIGNRNAGRSVKIQSFVGERNRIILKRKHCGAVPAFLCLARSYARLPFLLFDRRVDSASMTLGLLDATFGCGGLFFRTFMRRMADRDAEQSPACRQ